MAEGDRAPSRAPGSLVTPGRTWHGAPAAPPVDETEPPQNVDPEHPLGGGPPRAQPPCRGEGLQIATFLQLGDRAPASRALLISFPQCGLDERLHRRRPYDHRHPATITAETSQKACTRGAAAGYRKGVSGDLLDLILIALMVAFAVSGYRQGFIIGALSFVGFVGGGLLGMFVAPPIAGAVVDGETERALLAIVIVFLAATVGQFASSSDRRGGPQPCHLGARQGRRRGRRHLASAFSVLIIAWLIGSLLASSQFTLISEQVNRSLLLTRVDQTLPSAAKELQEPFKNFIDTSGFPKVFDAIGGGRARRHLAARPERGQGQQAAHTGAPGHRQGPGRRHGLPQAHRGHRVRLRPEQDHDERARGRRGQPGVAGHRLPGQDPPGQGRALQPRPRHRHPPRHRAQHADPALRRHRGEGRRRDRRRIPARPRLHHERDRVRVQREGQGLNIYERKTVVRDVYAIRGPGPARATRAVRCSPPTARSTVSSSPPPSTSRRPATCSPPRRSRRTPRTAPGSSTRSTPRSATRTDRASPLFSAAVPGALRRDARLSPLRCPALSTA